MFIMIHFVCSNVSDSITNNEDILGFLLKCSVQFFNLKCALTVYCPENEMDLLILQKAFGLQIEVNA